MGKLLDAWKNLKYYIETQTDIDVTEFDKLLTAQEGEDAYMKRIAPFLDRLAEPRFDEYETNDYICGSSDCKRALQAYQDWLDKDGE